MRYYTGIIFKLEIERQALNFYLLLDNINNHQLVLINY